MSVINVLAGLVNKAFMVDFKVGSFQFDVLLEENHESSVDVTENPVERGAPTTDHIIDNNDRLVVSGVILSNDPKIGGGYSTRKKDIYESLLAIKDAKQPVMIKTTLKDYQNMVLSGVAATQGETDRLDVVLSFVEIGIVETSTAEGLSVPPKKPPAEAPKNNPTAPKDVKKSDTPVSKGRVQPAPAKKKSAANKIGDIIRG